KLENCIDLNKQSLKIKKIDINRKRNIFLFIMQKQKEIINNNKSIQIPDPDDPYSSVYFYDIDTQVLHKPNLFNKPVDILDAKFSKNGNFLLLKINDNTNPGYYYIINTEKILEKNRYSNLDNIQPLNSFLSLNDFNTTERKIIGINFDRTSTSPTTGSILQTIDENLNIENITDGKKLIIDVIYANNTNDVIASEQYKEVEFTQGLFEIIKISENGKKTTMLNIDGFSLENPRISNDDIILAIEKYSVDQIQQSIFDELGSFLKRDYIFHFKPGNGNIILYNLQNNTIITEIVNGIDPEFID
ncbi:MAG: hypothetical protein NZZ41_05705, partial [Candidatus Dojkabacteria bacterium]|nr:hypothetical protein [Candidatus Dojkabacteria bacterium]